MNYAQVQALLPKTFKRSDVVQRSERVIEDVTLHVLPNWRTAADVWKVVTPKNAEAKKLISEIMRDLKGSGSFADRVLDRFENAVKILSFIGDYSEKIFSTNEASMGLSYAKITLMRSLQAADFAAKYSRSLLNYLCYLETSKDEKTGAPFKKEIEFVRDNTYNFCVALNAFQTEPKDFEKHLKSLPEASVSGLSEMTLVQTLGLSKFDPFGLRNFAVTWNPFYHIALMVAEYQSSSYREAEEETRLLQQRLLQLQQLSEGGQSDASVEKEIDVLQNRINGLKFKLSQMEEDYAL